MRRKIFSIALVVVVAASTVMGCSSKTQEKTTTDESASAVTESAVSEAASGDVDSTYLKDDGTQITVAFSQKNQLLEKYVTENTEMERYCKEKGIKYLHQVAEDDAQNQYNQCSEMIAQGADVLVIDPVDGEAAGTIVDMAHKEGVPVISYASPIMNSDVDLFVGHDAYEVAALEAQYVVDHLDKGNIVVMEGDPTDFNSQFIDKAVSDILAPKIESGDYKVVLQQPIIGWKPENAMAITEQALTMTNDDIQAIVGVLDLDVIGINQALESAGLNSDDVITTGMDGSATSVGMILNKQQTMSVFKNIIEMIDLCTEDAVLLAKGQADKVPVNKKMDYGYSELIPCHMMTPVVIDKENAKEVCIDSGYYTEEQVSSGE